MGEDAPKAAASFVLDYRGPGAFKEYLDTSPGPRWELWKRDFELIMEANGIVGAARRVWLLAQGGPDIQRLNTFLPPYEGSNSATIDDYEKLVARLDLYFKPKVLYVLERAKFRAIEQNPNERIDSFLMRLREQGSRCNFGNCLEIMIIDQIISKCRSEKLKEKLKEKDFTLARAHTIAVSLELQGGSKEVTVNWVDSKKKWKQHTANVVQACYSCGRAGHISTSERCPAKGKRCRKCNSVGHFENCCRKRKQPDEEAKNEAKKPRYGKVNAVQEDKPRPRYEKVNAVQEGKQDIYQLFYSGTGREDIKCEIGGALCGVLIDSGADLNIMGYEQWEALKEKKFNIWDVAAGNGGKVLRGYASNVPMEIKGFFTTSVLFKSKQITAQFFVVMGGNCVILGRESSEKLGVLKIGDNVNAISEVFGKIKGT